MALGVRELLLVIRARDEASRAMAGMARSMRNIDNETKRAAAAQIERGRALSSVGVGIMAVGAAGAKVIYDWSKAAIEYNRQAALTLTQVDKQKISLADIKKVGLDVAKAIPAPFKEMQASLYDIFSSMDVNLSGAKHLLTEFSKAAVAGQVDLRDASRATIGILNAYRLGAEGVNRVNDVMFQLVRKGVGTYGQFANVIGRAVPSAVRAGQSIENLAGMMAFLTRNGLSAAMASASAGRALDAISNPKTITNFADLGNYIKEAIGPEQADRAKKLGISFESLGVSVVDAKGKFRPMNDIMTDLGKIFAKLQLTGPQIAEVMQGLFKGSGGTIQARRFFDVAVKNFTELNKLTKDMHNSAGALGDAYNTMLKQPASQIQLLKNNFEVLKVEMGESFLPIINELVKAFIKLMTWFNNLSPTTRKWIAYTLLAVTAITLLVGVVLTVVGGIMMLAGAAAAVGVGLGTVAAIAAAVVVAIAAIGTAVFFIIKYWNVLVPFFTQFWPPIIAGVKAAWNAIVGVIRAVWPVVWTIIRVGWTVVSTIFKVVLAIIITIVILYFKLFIKPVIGFVGILILSIRNGWNLAVGVFKWAFNIISTVTKAGWAVIRAVISAFWGWAGPYFRAGARVLISIWNTMFGPIKTIASAAWNVIKSGMNAFWGAMKTGFRAGVNAVVGIWNTIKKPLAGPVNFLINTIWNNGIAKAWNTAVDIVKLPAKFRAPHLSGIQAATGGHIRGPGGPTDDAIPAWLSNGEFVVRASQTKKWLPVLQAINGGMKPRGGGIPGFQLGGLVDKIKGATGFLMDIITDPVGAMKKALTHAMGSLAGFGDGFGQIVSAVPKRMIDMLVQGFKEIWKKFGGGVSGNAGKAIAFARAQIGKWYQWGATGPDTYDCSGLTMRAWQAAGKDITRTTYTQRQALRTIPGPIPGAVGQPHPGHTYMCSRINPVSVVEAAQTGTRISEHVLTRATPWWGYPRAAGGLTQVGKMVTYGRLARTLMGSNYIYDRHKMMAAKRMGLAGDPGGVVPGFRGPMIADSGGYLRPGLNAVMNHTGGAERILNRAETIAYERGRGASVPITIITNEINPRKHAADLGWELQRRVT